MSFVTGLLLIDAPASALNNAAATGSERNDNTVAVKSIKTRAGNYPYVSAQSFRYWLRSTLEKNKDWQSAPIFRENKVAYTDANPILWWDDDLFGYMRAQSTKKTAREKRDADVSRASETPTTDALTRASPFRVSTLVSVAPVNITTDFGVMSRHEGDPVPYEHEFYRATLKGLFSLDLKASGTFSYRRKTGYLNLDQTRVDLAIERGLHHLEQEKAYQLSIEERIERIAALFEGIGRLEGGAKQGLHYTDVAPPFLMMAITSGGNHIFNHAIEHDVYHLPVISPTTVSEILRVFRDQLLSPIYLGWSSGYLAGQRGPIESALAESGVEYHSGHPLEVLALFVNDLRSDRGRKWLS